MADSILSSLLSKAALSIVGSSDSNGTNVARNLKVSRVQIKYSARAMRHMREDGVSIVDARMIDPIVIDLEVICPTLDELTAVNNLLMDRSNTYTFTSKSIVVNEVTADDIQVKQTPDMLSASPVKINLKQLQRQGGTTVEVHQVVEQPADSSIFNRGIQTVQRVQASVTTTFNKTLSAIDFLDG